MAKTKPTKKADKPTTAVVVATDARPRKNFKSNLPRDPITGKPLQPPNAGLSKLPRQIPRDAVLDAFHRLGGRRWLTRFGKTNPKEFVSLLARVMPTDVNVTGTFGYVPQVIPVEQRDAIPGECIDVTPKVATPASEPDPFM